MKPPSEQLPCPVIWRVNTPTPDGYTEWSNVQEVVGTAMSIEGKTCYVWLGAVLVGAFAGARTVYVKTDDNIRRAIDARWIEASVLQPQGLGTLIDSGGNL